MDKQRASCGSMLLRGAISGFGAVAACAHLPGWQSRPGVNIVAVHDPAAARRHHAINLVKNIRVYDDLELMLDGEALDFLDVASPPACHGAAAKLALEAGVSVIVEKPLCLTAGEFAELSDLAARDNRLLMCVHNWKYSPTYRHAHELITGGRLGEVKYVSLVRMRTTPAGAVPGGSAIGERWRLDKKMGGGILIDHGWHIFYLLQWLMGDKPTSVSSYIRSDASTGVDDFADLRIEFPGARIANVLLTWGSPVRRTADTVVGTAGLLEIAGDKIALTGIEESFEHSVDDAPDDSYHARWFATAASDYERALTDGPQSAFARVNLDEARTALALSIAARQSAAQHGRAVELNFADLGPKRP